MTARDRLAAVLAPDVLAALEELVSEQVAQAFGEVPAGSPWLSIEAAAERAGVSARTLERAIKSGRLRTSTVGRRRLVHADELDGYVRGDGRGEARTAPARRPRGV
jgi:excisionase family DNA binding protein